MTRAKTLESSLECLRSGRLEARTREGAQHGKGGKWTGGRSFLILRAKGNHFKVLLKAIKERNDETSLFKKIILAVV